MKQHNNIIFTEPQFNDRPSAWIEHIPFAFFLIEMLRPKTFVELGTQFGNSYFAFCQAINQLKLPSKAFGVDIWVNYGEGIFEGRRVFEYANQINSSHFSHFSNLMLMTFDEALEYFDDAEIDLLHIDGMHDYTSVKHDFETWLPKMSDAGVIIMHDSNVRENGFGVWKLAEEIKTKYPTFSFNFGKGLTLACVGKNPPGDIIEFIKLAEDDSFTHNLFYALGNRLLLKNHVELQKQQHQQTIQNLNNQIVQLEARIQSMKTDKLEIIPPDPPQANEAPENTDSPLWLRLRRKITSFIAIRQIRKSTFFDEAYYLLNNPDVAKSGISPARHYLLFGGFEGRNPSEKFNSAFYLRQNPDVKASGMNPLLHYLSYGKAERRQMMS